MLLRCEKMGWQGYGFGYHINEDGKTERINLDDYYAGKDNWEVVTPELEEREFRENKKNNWIVCLSAAFILIVCLVVACSGWLG